MFELHLFEFGWKVLNFAKGNNSIQIDTMTEHPDVDIHVED